MIIDYLQIVKEQFSETGKRPKYRCGSDRDLDVEWLFSFVDRFFRRNRMKRWVLSMLLVSIFVPALAVGEEFGGQEDIERQMELHAREMELKQREAEMELERRKAELDLEGHKMKLEHWRKAQKGGPHPLLALILIVHILAAVWVYQDIRQRGCGSGIWIVIALLTGLLGTLVYAVVRLGDEKKKA